MIAVMDLISDCPETDCGFIGLFMMDNKFQNKGIGSDIIHDVLRYLKMSKFKKVRLGVDKGIALVILRAIHSGKRMDFL